MPRFMTGEIGGAQIMWGQLGRKKSYHIFFGYQDSKEKKKKKQPLTDIMGSNFIESEICLMGGK